MNALHIKNTVLAVLAAAGSAIAQALGGLGYGADFPMSACRWIRGYSRKS
uniref:Uncharacterized protein n=1 Tax=Siphoviridae sp. ctoiW10 TaxID=2827592 RepID=A0A8S5LPV2_9CAUD|nr:MAG TPA: hypothetical protein [Siphoviridae sp. ctoiW10]